MATFHLSTSNSLKLCVVILCLSSEVTLGQLRSSPGLMRQSPRSGIGKAPAAVCSHDTLLIYQDCRMCACPRANQVAKCFKKPCDLRTKDGGQCPPSYLKLDDWKLCTVEQGRSCKIDTDCPGAQLCCFDFCGSPKCIDPIPLDVTTGLVSHGGRGYAI